jgi:hypothetical protein
MLGLSRMADLFGAHSPKTVVHNKPVQKCVWYIAKVIVSRPLLEL